MTNDPSGNTRFRPVSAICALVVTLAGWAALAGWLSGKTSLVALSPVWVPMAPSTALLFILSGTAVLLRVYLGSRRGAWLAANLIVSACGSLAIILFTLSCMDIHPGWEHLGMVIAGTRGSAPMGHISPVTAFCFVIAALSFLVSDTFYRNSHWSAITAWWLNSLLIAMNMVFLLPYLYGSPLLYGGPFIPPAITTVISFLVLGTSLFAVSAKAAPPLPALNGTTRSAERLLVFIFVLLSSGIVIAGYMYYRHFEQSQRLDAEKQLSAIADLKVNQLVLWRNERFADAAAIQENPAFSALVRRHFAEPGDREAEGELKGWLKRIQAANRYDRVYLFDLRGALRITAKPQRGAESCAFNYVSQAIRSGKLMFLDFHRDCGKGPIHISLLVPILDEAGGGRILGALLLSIDPSHELYPYIQSWPLPSKSSETLLVRREANEVVYLNQLRFDKREPLSIHLPISSEDLPAAKAVMGKEEVMDGLDYRGVAVVAALRRVPDSPWYLVAKMDATEIYAPLRERLWSVVALVAALLIGASAGVGLIWRQHSAAFYKERLRIELEKSRSDDRYRELVQNANSAIIRWRSDGIITFFNEYAQTFFGYPGDEAIGRHISTLLPDSDSGGSDLSGLIADIVQSPERFISNDNENVCRDGRRVWMSWTNKPILDDRGKVVEILAVGSDMTARKQAEDALLASKAKLEAALDSMTDAVFISDSEGRFIEFNESFATFHRFKSKEECARTFADYPALLDVFMANGEPAPPEQWAVPRALRGETSRNSEYTLRRKDSGETWVGSYSFAPIRDGSGAIVGSVVTGRDITEHKRADEALRDREELLRLFIEYAPAPLAMFDREMRYLYVSRRWKSDYHLGEQDLRGLSHYEVFPEISGEWKEIHRRGQMGEIIRSDNDRFQREDGSVQWLRWEVRPWRDAAGSVGGILIFSEDITDQRRQEEELREKNLELERLNYTVSHDLKSPLVTVKTFLGYLELDLAKGDSSRIGQDMMYMRTAAERMSNLLDDLFDFSRLGKTSWPPVDVSFTEIAREAVNLVAGRISQRGVKIELADSPVMLHGDRQRLLQLWQNLVENSVKFMGEQAAPRIEVGVKCGAAKEKVFFVMDNGQGIDPRYKEKIFGLFEQLDPGIEGTGIGLALVKRIVELYGGALWMESEGPCKGTTFFFTLPKAIKNM